VDWSRGNYWLVERGGRIDSPAGTGELKKTLQMIGEGSVIYAPSAPQRRSAGRGARRFPASGVPRRLRGFRSAARGELMRYRLTCLTPLLVGDGRKLSPIDYMVWKDHVNVLDQWRIFRLLAKGPAPGRLSGAAQDGRQARFRLLGRLRAELRRPPHSVRKRRLFGLLESRRRREPAHSHLCRGRFRPVPARRRHQRSVAHRHAVRQLARRHAAGSGRKRVKGERPPRHPAESVEEQALGPSGSNRMRFVARAIRVRSPTTQFKVYLLRTSTLQPRGAGFCVLGWKQSPRGAVDGARPDDSTPAFAEMAAPGTTFEGRWDEKNFLLQPEVRRIVRWPESLEPRAIFEAANVYAAACSPCSGSTHRGPGWACWTKACRLWSSAWPRHAKRLLPAVARLGRRPARQERLARHQQRGLPRDSPPVHDSTTARWTAISRSPRPAASSS
jgi:CRISPR-associated protein Csm5